MFISRGDRGPSSDGDAPCLCLTAPLHHSSHDHRCKGPSRYEKHASSTSGIQIRGTSSLDEGCTASTRAIHSPKPTRSSEPQAPHQHALDKPDSLPCFSRAYWPVVQFVGFKCDVIVVNRPFVTPNPGRKTSAVVCLLLDDKPNHFFGAEAIGWPGIQSPGSLCISSF
jgi:hypothetical protein